MLSWCIFDVTGDSEIKHSLIILSCIEQRHVCVTFQEKLNVTAPYLEPEVESRTQGSRPRPRTQKNPRPRTAFPRTDTLEAKDRNARGQGQGHKRKCSPKKRSSQKFFRRSPKKKKGLHKNFSSDLHKKTFSKKFFKRFTKF